MTRSVGCVKPSPARFDKDPASIFTPNHIEYGFPPRPPSLLQGAQLMLPRPVQTDEKEYNLLDEMR